MVQCTSGFSIHSHFIADNTVHSSPSLGQSPPDGLRICPLPYPGPVIFPHQLVYNELEFLFSFLSTLSMPKCQASPSEHPPRSELPPTVVWGRCAGSFASPPSFPLSWAGWAYTSSAIFSICFMLFIILIFY